MDNTTLLRQVPALLATTPERWLRITATAPLDLLTRASAPGEWSAADCLSHLLDTERDVFPIRIRAFLAGQDIPAFDPDTEKRDTTDQPNPAAMANELARLRAQSLALVQTLTPADLDRMARHSELGQVTLGQMLHEWVAHDLNHTIQAERALMQPFIAGCGPWRDGFADHDQG